MSDEVVIASELYTVPSKALQESVEDDLKQEDPAAEVATAALKQHTQPFPAKRPKAEEVRENPQGNDGSSGH
jgi:hypothetical protein